MNGIISRALAALLAISLISGCSSPGERRRETIAALDTMTELTVYGGRGAAGLDAAKDTIFLYESLLSVTHKGSDIYRINNAGGAPVKVDAMTASLVQMAAELSTVTGGGFDITVRPLMLAWGFTTQEFRIPESEELSALLEYVDYRQVAVDSAKNTITVPPGAALDLGGVAKGYIGDRVIDALREEGVTSAIINLGGNVQALGVKPDGSGWTVGIRSPDNPAEAFCTVTTGEGAVITSGGYQRYFTGPDGAVYHHIIDPATGYPASGDLLSVTVVSSGGQCGFYGDGLSTAMFVLGKDASLGLWRTLGGRIGDTSFELIIVTGTGDVVITPGLSERVLLTSDEFRLAVADGS